MTTTSTLDWIRPWYPAGVDATATGRGPMVLTGHIYPDCEHLLRVDSDPREGSGWLDPRMPGACPDCLHRHDPKLYAELYENDSKDAK